MHVYDRCSKDKEVPCHVLTTLSVKASITQGLTRLNETLHDLLLFFIPHTVHVFIPCSLRLGELFDFSPQI